MAGNEGDAGNTFRASAYDAAKAEEACRKLAAAYAASDNDCTDSGAVGEAMGLAVEAFPGLQDFAFALEDGGADASDLVLDHSGVAGDDRLLVAAAARLAAVGAAAEVNEGFEWHDVDACVVPCQEAVAALPAGPGSAGPR